MERKKGRKDGRKKLNSDKCCEGNKETAEIKTGVGGANLFR